MEQDAGHPRQGAASNRDVWLAGEVLEVEVGGAQRAG